MEKLSIEEFGLHLLNSGDLDPIYVMLSRAMDAKILTRQQLHAWCVAYWLDYNAGVACAAVEYCEQEGYKFFWRFMNDVANNLSRRWPRGSERRHFRGDNANKLVLGLSMKYDLADHFIESVFGSLPDYKPEEWTRHHVAKTMSFKDVALRIQSHVGLGPWIAFKIADMGERVLGYNVNFDDCQMGIYRDPVKGAIMACEKWGPNGDDTVRVGKAYEQACLNYALNRLAETFGDLYAPPLIHGIDAIRGRGNRFVNVQEYETILCKWKSHMNGHYPLNKDTHEIRETLKEFAWDCNQPTLANKLANYLPQAQA